MMKTNLIVLFALSLALTSCKTKQAAIQEPAEVMALPELTIQSNEDLGHPAS